MIFLGSRIIATTTDLLNGTRLESIPDDGVLKCRFLSDLNNDTNNYELTIQLPGGDVPVDSQRVPGTNPATVGIMDDRQLLQFEFIVLQGGKVVIALVEAGAAELNFQIVFNARIVV